MLKRLKREKADKSPTDSEEEKGGIKEFLSTIVWALGIAFVLRTFIFQPFTIPSPSMYPGLLEGDYVITSKYSVGYGKFAAKPLPFPDVKGRFLGRGPERGDVIVFRPEGVNENYIKRVIGVPGDRVQMIEGRLWLNGEAVPTEFVGTEDFVYLDKGVARGEFVVERLIETLPGYEHPYPTYDLQKNSTSDNTGIFTVPAGQYFMMGDNRDRSGDSRTIVGYVPAENIIGRAEFILLSVNEDFALFKPWTWLNFRGDRFFKPVR
jgi:signal peptidase I